MWAKLRWKKRGSRKSFPSSKHLSFCLLLWSHELCDLFCAWAMVPSCAILPDVGMTAHILCSDFIQLFSFFYCLPSWNFPLVTSWLKFHWVSFCLIDNMPCFTHCIDNIWSLLLILRASQGEESTCQCRRCRSCGLNPQFRKIPWRRKWQSTLVFLLGQSHEQKSPAGYSP